MMQTLNFYEPVASLIHLILTGEQKKYLNQEVIEVNDNFLNSVNKSTHGSFNSYFLNCIEQYLKHCNADDRVNIVRVLYDNDSMLSGAYIVTMVKEKESNIQGDHFADNFKKMMQDYIIGKKVHFTLCLALYFYIENISKVKINDKKILMSTYKNLMKHNSVKRNLDNSHVK